MILVLSVLVRCRFHVVEHISIVVLIELLHFEVSTRRELGRDLLERLVLGLRHEEVDEQHETDEQDDEYRKRVFSRLQLQHSAMITQSLAKTKQHRMMTLYKKLSYRGKTARCFVSVNISLSHSRSLEVIRNDTLE